MASFCWNCGSKFSLIQGALSDGLCNDCKESLEAQRQARLNSLQQSIAQLEASADSTDIVYMLEKFELLREEVELLAAHAGYRLSDAGQVEGDGDPKKLDKPRITYLLNQITAIIDSLIHSNIAIDDASLPRLQALVGKAGIIIDDDGNWEMHLFTDTHFNDLTQAEKNELRRILSGETQIIEEPAATTPPVKDVSGAVFCRSCGEPISSNSKFCNKCGTRR